MWGTSGRYHREAKLEPVRAVGAFAHLVEQSTFLQVREILGSRNPSVRPPREAGSSHLLSGLLRCGGCKGKMFGQLARTRGHSYVYYVCATAYRQGRRSCSMRSLPKEQIEGAVLRNITATTLSNENLKELVRLTNEELSSSTADARNRLAHLDDERDQIQTRLSNGAGVGTPS